MPDMAICNEHKGKKCLALDLDETLVHSSFQVYLVNCCSDIYMPKVNFVLTTF